MIYIKLMLNNMTYWNITEYCNWLNRTIYEGYEFSSHKKNTFVTGQRQNMISMECVLTSQKSSITTCPQRSFLFVKANGAWYMILKHLMMAAMPLLCFSLIATFLLYLVSRSSREIKWMLTRYSIIHDSVSFLVNVE